MLPPDNIDDVLRLIRNMEGYYRRAMDGFDEDNNFYEGLLDDSIEVPEGYDITIPTTARAIIDEAVDNIEPYELIINYSPRSFGKQAQIDADTVSRFLKNVWRYWRQTGSDIDILRDFIKNLVKNGKAIFKVVPDWSLWPVLEEEEEKSLYEEGGRESVKERVQLIKQLRKENFPIICRSISPRHIIEDPTMDSRKLWAIETYQADIEEIRNRYSAYDPMLSDFEPHGYMVREVWTGTWVDSRGRLKKGRHWVFVNDTCVNGENGEINPYGDIPYIIKHSSFGTETYDGEPEKKAVGFYSRQVKSMLRAEVRRVTHFDVLMQQLAFPIAALPDTLEDIGFDSTPGAVNFVPTEFMEHADKIFIQAKLPAPEYMQSINMIQAQIERGTTQRAIRGAGVPGTDSAAQLSMITAQAKLRLEPLKRATEEAVDMVNHCVLKYIEQQLDSPVSIFAAEPTGKDAYTLKPSQINGRYRTRTNFAPNEDQTKERKLVLITDAMTKAGLNPYDAYTYAGWENPMEVIARNLAYELMKQPALQRQLAKEALNLWGLDATELEIEEMNDNNMLQQMMAELQNKAAGMGQGAPGQPIAPEQGQGGEQMMPEMAPQAQGAPLAMPNQMPDVNGMQRETGMM